MELSDYDRDLIDIGIKRTHKVGNWLKSKEINPEIFISSPANRAYKTAKILAKTLSYDVDKIITIESLYPGSYENIIETLYPLPDKVEQILIVGHNPVITDVVNSFLEPSQQINNLPTSAVASVTFNTNSWEKVELASTVVNFIVTPKDI